MTFVVRINNRPFGRVVRRKNCKQQVWAGTSTSCLALLFASAALFCAGCERAAWKDADAQDDIRAYERFLEEYPDSEYASEARRRLENRLDSAAWNSATKEGTPEAIKYYLREHPSGAFHQDAIRLLNVLLDPRELEFAILRPEISRNATLTDISVTLTLSLIHI